MSNEKEDQLLQDYIQRLELAEQMLPIIGRLYRNNGMLMRIYGRAINNVTTVDILKTHRFARQYTGKSCPSSTASSWLWPWKACNWPRPKWIWAA